MTTQPCIRCNGTKKHAPMGGIVKTCDLCNGVGYTISDNATASQNKRLEAQGLQPIQTNDTIVIRKKPGRKPGWAKPILQVAPETATISE